MLKGLEMFWNILTQYLLDSQKSYETNLFSIWSVQYTISWANFGSLNPRRLMKKLFKKLLINIDIDNLNIIVDGK